MRALSLFLLLFVCFVSGGATCVRRDAPMPFPQAPAVLSEMPSINDVAAAVNRTSTVRQLSTNSASVDVLSMPALPTLNATINLERSQNFRLNASLPVILGSVLDMGSNDQRFWFQVPEGVSMQKTLYYANHEQYRQKLNRAILPVDPTWVMDALGLVQIDPTTVVAGPVRRADGKLEVRSTIMMPSGTYQRVCLIDPAAGFVTHQFLYAPGGKLVATSEASKHRYYEEHQCALPHLVKLNLQPANGPPLSLQIDVGTYVVNQLLTGDPQIFSMPRTANQSVDLTQLGSGMPAMQPPNMISPTGYTKSGPLGPMPYRGTVR